jgi:hypothetical protein
MLLCVAAWEQLQVGHTIKARPHRPYLALRLLPIIALVTLNSLFSTSLIPSVEAHPSSNVATIAPSASNWGVFVGSSGDVHIRINKTGIAARVEVPREFSAGIRRENDTSFIESDIRNDYYYYNVVDESAHWSYTWKGNDSDAPCSKPNFTFYDPNSPWCVEIWNYLNGSFLTFTPPKTIKLTLEAPQVAGIYNFTLFVADKTNSLNAPDFIHAWNETLFVPVTMRDNPASITGIVLDHENGQPIKAKGIVYALSSGKVVARTFVNETTGDFNLTGLDPSIPGGVYDVEASAGIFKEPDGTPVAFSLTDRNQIEGVGCAISSYCNISLYRAPQIWGSLNYYYDTPNPTIVPNALTAHPWLKSAGFNVLNITVEALDLGNLPVHHVYRNFTVSQDSSSDRFEIITGQGSRYPGVDPDGTPDPWGTEFAGLPGGVPGTKADLSVFAWVSGYNLNSAQTVEVTPPNGGPPNTGTGANVQLSMIVGSAIQGVLRFNLCPDPCTPPNRQLSPMKPIDVEQRIEGSQTRKLYGGNIVIEAYDSANTLRGITVMNKTLPDGNVTFWDSTEVPFIIFGFSEFLNRSVTLAGARSVQDGKDPSRGSTSIPLCSQQTAESSASPLCWKDAALPFDTYTLKVYVRGYELDPGGVSSPCSVANPCSVMPGNLTTLTSPIEMVATGTVDVVVASYTNRPGTMVVQAPSPWRFLNLSIPVRARVYFYDSQGYTLGFVEQLLTTANPDVQPKTFKVAFAGENWGIRDILFLGERPNYVPRGNAAISAFTLGYVQQFPGMIPTPPVFLGALTSSFIVLFLGNEIDLTAPLFDNGILTEVPEHQHIIAEATSPALAGAITENLTVGLASPLDFPIYGFGGMIYVNLTSVPVSQSFVGQGHFFYVPRDEIVNPRCVNYGFLLRDANRCFDYGMGKATFQVNVPEYGFSWHFTQLNTTSPTLSFSDLVLEQGAGIFLIKMAKLTQDSNYPISGENDYPIVCAPPVPLSWVQVQAQTGGQQMQTTTTYDGNYTLFLRGNNTYSLSFVLPGFYPQQPSPPLDLGTLTWGSTTPKSLLPWLVPSRGSSCGVSSGLTVSTPAWTAPHSGIYGFVSKWLQEEANGFVITSTLILSTLGFGKRLVREALKKLWARKGIDCSSRVAK